MFLCRYQEPPITERITSDAYIHRLLGPTHNVKQEVLNISHYDEPGKRLMGKSHLTSANEASWILSPLIPRRKGGDSEHAHAHEDTSTNTKDCFEGNPVIAQEGNIIRIFWKVMGSNLTVTIQFTQNFAMNDKRYFLDIEFIIHLRFVHSTVVFLHKKLSFAICLCL
jgi:hypothetical protein